MENAFDAGATYIEVSVVDGGLKLLRVADNGCGMDRDNALLSVERHATSKIRHVDDIEKVATLGFRGEALAAISSVSRFTLSTRRTDDVSGTEIVINGGRIEDVRDAGIPPGTKIDVRQLFFNVPARRKFMKSPATELNHIRQVFMLYAMGRPDVGLRLLVDEREIYRLDGDSQLEDRIRQMHGSDILRDLVAVNLQHDDWSVTGLVSNAHLHRADKTEQYIFINQRPASAPVLGYAIGEVFQEVLDRGRHPMAFLFINLPPEEVDVNVHPTKKEVRFRHGARVRDLLIHALRAAITTSSAVNNASAAVNNASAAGVKSPQQDSSNTRVGEFLKVPDLPQLPAFQYPRKRPDSIDNILSESEQSHVDKGDGQSVSPFKAPWNWCRIVGQIGGYFVVLETDEGMILMDPQAAHERVLYDRLLATSRKKQPESQGLLMAESITLTPVKAGYIRKSLAILRDIGFGISEFGGDTFVLDAVPAVIKDADGATLLSDISSALESQGKASIGKSLGKEQIAQAAAFAAVRTTTQLSREQLERLVSDLSMTELPYTSPRGRPTIIFTSIQELKKKFGRS